MTPLDQGVRQPERRVVKHPAKTKSPGADLLQPYLYRSQNLVEQFFNRIKQCRRTATRYYKLTTNYLAFVKLASIRLWLRAYKS